MDHKFHDDIRQIADLALVQAAIGAVRCGRGDTAPATYFRLHIAGRIRDQLRREYVATGGGRDKRRQETRHTLEWLVLSGLEPTVQAEVAIARAEAGEFLRRLLADGFETEHTVVVLYYVYGLRLREIGNLMGKSEGRVSQLRGRAIGRLVEMATAGR